MATAGIRMSSWERLSSHADTAPWGFGFRISDTNVVSEMRKPKPHGAVSAWLESLSHDDIRIPAVAIAELQNGVELTRHQNPSKATELDRWIDRLLATFAVLPMDGPMFRDWACLMFHKQSNL